MRKTPGTMVFGIIPGNVVVVVVVVPKGLSQTMSVSMSHDLVYHFPPATCQVPKAH